MHPGYEGVQRLRRRQDSLQGCLQPLRHRGRSRTAPLNSASDTTISLQTSGARPRTSSRKRRVHAASLKRPTNGKKASTYHPSSGRVASHLKKFKT